MSNLNELLKGVEKGSVESLSIIANANVGERSEAAKRVLEKRYERKQWMEKGLTLEQAILITNDR
jgi:20S proteasome alpha/beta subunit